MTPEFDNANATGPTVAVCVSNESANVAQSAPRGEVPTIVNRAQSYYWTRTWQKDEESSLRDIEEDDTVSFSGTDSALRWLLSTDDE